MAKGFTGASKSEGGGAIFVNLTPMMDMLTSLLFFLLVNMASQSLTVESSQGMLLPFSTSNKELVLSLNVTVTVDAIKVQEKPVVFFKNGEIEDKYLEDKGTYKVIAPLYNTLVKQIEQTRDKGLDPKEENSIVLLMADKRLKSEMIVRVMQTCGSAGIVNFHFGVIKS